MIVSSINASGSCRSGMRDLQPPILIASGVAILQLQEGHIASATRLHQQTFPDETLARLGPRVTAAVYRTYLDSPRGLAFVAIHEKDVVGVVSGAIGPGFVREVVRRHRWSILGAAVLCMARSPLFIRQLVAMATRRDDPWKGDRARRFYWRAQVIAPEWRGKGIVVPLVRALLEEARRCGARDACSTVFDNNLAAIWVHKVFGFESRDLGTGPRHYRLDLERLDGAGVG
jgi:GNAT superfamily N-acetyltransferase